MSVDDPLLRLELERMGERAEHTTERRRRSGAAWESLRERNPESPHLVDEPEELEPLTTERRLQAFLDFAIAVHLEPELDEEHAIRAQLEWLRGEYVRQARDEEERLAWLDVLTDATLDETAATLARYWPTP